MPTFEQFVKWKCRGRNISNAVSYWVYSATGGVGRSMVPADAHIELALRNVVHFPRYEGWWREELVKISPSFADAEVARFDRTYFGGLTRRSVERAAEGRPLPAR
jgi:hypothetical protein